MRKLLLLIFVILTITGYSQEISYRETTIGINQACNLSNVSFEPQIVQYPLIGYSGGISFTHKAHPNAGILIELNFTQKGWKEKWLTPDALRDSINIDVDTINSYQRRISYIEMPFLSNFTLGKSNSKVVINFGPALTSIISDNESIDIAHQLGDSTHYGAKIDHKLGYSICFGLGFIQETNFGNFQLEARVNRSLTKLFDRKLLDASYGYMQMVAIRVTYSYKLFD